MTTLAPSPPPIVERSLRDEVNDRHILGGVSDANGQLLLQLKHYDDDDSGGNNVNTSSCMMDVAKVVMHGERVLSPPILSITSDDHRAPAHTSTSLPPFTEATIVPQMASPPPPRSGGMGLFLPPHINQQRQRQQQPPEELTDSDFDSDTDSDEDQSPLNNAQVTSPPFSPVHKPHRRQQRRRHYELRMEDIQLKEKIGEGSFGEVLRGTLWGQEVAVKRLRMNDNATTNKLKEIWKEIRIMRDLRHPNIVEFLGATTEPDCTCIVTEYLSNGSLEDLLNELEKTGRKLRMRRIVSIAMDIARGLNWLHHKGIIHRDLKPANLLMDNNKKVKLADFGLAHVKKTQNRPGCYGVLGTPCYMAPEVINQLPYGVEADVFSFGIVVCELIMGRYPYDGAPESTMTFERAISSGLRPEIPPNTPSDMKALIEVCWHEDPNQRPQADTITERLYLIEERLKTECSVIDDLPEEAQDMFYANQRRLADLRTQLDKQTNSLRARDNRITQLEQDIEAFEQAEDAYQKDVENLEKKLKARNKELRRVRALLKKYQTPKRKRETSGNLSNKRVATSTGVSRATSPLYSSGLRLRSRTRSSPRLRPSPRPVVMPNFVMEKGLLPPAFERVTSGTRSLVDANIVSDDNPPPKTKTASQKSTTSGRRRVSPRSVNGAAKPALKPPPLRHLPTG